MQRLALLLLLIAPLAAGGCGLLVAPAVGVAGQIAFSARQGYAPAEPEQTLASARGAVDDLGFGFVEENYDPKTRRGVVVCRTDQDKKIETKVAGESADLSRLSVRIGLFGDRPLQTAMERAILARLPTPAWNRPRVPEE